MKAHLRLLLFFLLLSAVSANAVEVVGIGKVHWIENGWAGEGVAFAFTKSIAGCTAPASEFAISKDHVGYKEMVSMLLAAQASAQDVQLVVEAGTCLIGSRTKVVAIRVIK